MILFVGTLLNARFIAKKKFQNGNIWFFSKLSNTFFIDNENKNKIIENKPSNSKKLQEGENFIIFPEGTTSDGNGILISNPQCWNVLLMIIIK